MSTPLAPLPAVLPPGSLFGSKASIAGWFLVTEGATTTVVFLSSLSEHAAVFGPALGRGARVSHPYASEAEATAAIPAP